MEKIAFDCDAKLVLSIKLIKDITQRQRRRFSLCVRVCECIALSTVSTLSEHVSESACGVKYYVTK